VAIDENARLWLTRMEVTGLLPIYMTVRKLHQLPITAAAHSPAIA